jgi:hypothetical protein
MVFGGGLIWAVRIVGSSALGQEAMGFGDVTLMAMIGAFTGWQATLIIFFLAPFAAVLISVTQWLLTRRKDIAFGPYLCLAALFTVVDWGDIWMRSAGRVFELGWFIPVMVPICLVLMAGMLSVLRLLRQWRESLYHDLPQQESNGTAQPPDGTAVETGETEDQPGDDGEPDQAQLAPDEDGGSGENRDTPDELGLA